MAAMRPLFTAFLSHSKLFGSTSHTNGRNSTYPGGRGTASRLGYFRKRDLEVDELELQTHSDLGKSIRVVTTITNSESIHGEGKREGRANSTESEAALKGERKWGANLESESYEDVDVGVGVGYRTMIQRGMAV
jgi:hypothetical protein